MISSAVVNRYANALADVVLLPGSDVQPVEAIAQLRAFQATVGVSRSAQRARLAGYSGGAQAGGAQGYRLKGSACRASCGTSFWC